jgi:hypothetical protein
MSAPPAAPAQSARAIALRSLGAAAVAGALFVLIVEASAALDYGRDFHALRVVATLGVIAPAAVVLLWPNRNPYTRIGAGLFAVAAGAAAWWHVPCWSGGPSLLKAVEKRDTVRALTRVPPFEDEKLARRLRDGLDDLARDYPTLAEQVRPDLALWADSAADEVAERLRAIPSVNITAVRELRNFSVALTGAFPDHRARLDGEFRAWAVRAAKDRADELNATSLTAWDGFDRTAGVRQALVKAFPETRDELAASERFWVTRATGRATAHLIPMLKDDPKQARAVCRDIEQRVRAMKSLDTGLDKFRVARAALFSIAHDAARAEVRRHFDEHRYDLAFAVARAHAVDWFPTARLLGGEELRGLESLRDGCRYLANLQEKAGGPVEPIPPPRERETAPPPRPKL